jgi:hypothetical protein
MSIYKLRKFSFIPDKDHVVMLLDGKRICEMGWKESLIIWRKAYTAAKEAEEYAKANEIIFHNSILRRAGAPIGLSSLKGIVKETVKESWWDKQLRRYMPNRINSEAVVLGPRIINHGLRREGNGKTS